jgi:hypothetical protein
MAEEAGTGDAAYEDGADRHTCRAAAIRPPSAIRIDLLFAC